jgi:hypothetical protein
MILTKKVNQTRISEQTYRSIKEDISYSVLKKYNDDRAGFFKEYVLGETINKKESDTLTMGSLIHCLLAGEEGMFDSKFHIASTPKPTGQMGDLCDNLFKRTLEGLRANDNGEKIQQDSFATIFSDALQRTQYNYKGQIVAFKDKEPEWILNKFQTEGGQMYYDECIDTIGKTVVVPNQIERAEKQVNKLKEHPFSSEYVNAKTDEYKEVFHELPIRFKILGKQYKCMPDKLIVEHETKTVQLVDWKTSYDTDEEQDLGRSYLKYGYYIQAAIYDYGVKEWLIQHKLEGYTVMPMMFVFIDTTGFNDPIILKLSTDDVERAWRGFHVSGRKYTGVTKIIQSLHWALESGVWTSSEDSYKNHGIVKLQLKYGTK